MRCRASVRRVQQRLVPTHYNRLDTTRAQRSSYQRGAGPSEVGHSYVPAASRGASRNTVPYNFRLFHIKHVFKLPIQQKPVLGSSSLLCFQRERLRRLHFHGRLAGEWRAPIRLPAVLEAWRARVHRACNVIGEDRGEGELARGVQFPTLGEVRGHKVPLRSLSANFLQGFWVQESRLIEVARLDIEQHGKGEVSAPAPRRHIAREG